MKYIKYTLGLIFFSVVANSVFAEPPLKTRNRKSATTVTAGCLPASAETNLDLNNVRALMYANGSLWQGDTRAEYEIPKGSGKTALYAGSIWIGGVDVNGQLRTCAKTFRGEGDDFWTGPLITEGEGIASVSPEVCVEYDRLYKITREEVEDFVAWFDADADTKATMFPNYEVPKIINEWPAHGPSENNYDYYLAPFEDVDGDGAYNPGSGDYPLYELETLDSCGYQPERRAENLGNTSQKLFGDMTTWWVYNDKGNVHTASVGAAAIGMEIRAQGFAFSTNDELNNMTFYNYQIINRSTYSLTNAYFGVWNDPDLGDAEDDLAGCDVVRGLGYVYNADNIDGEDQDWAYGANPPAIGFDFFEGPYQDPDGEDNLTSWENFERTTLNCEQGYTLNPENTGDNTLVGVGDFTNGNINGLNFGDGTPDNERWGMRRFIYYIRASSGYNQDPSTALHFYNYLKGYWADGTRMTYGDKGYGGDTPADFLFPDDSDKCGWGTNGIPQLEWKSELGDDNSEDMRIVQSAGPFVLEPGAVNDITVGVVWARSNEGHLESIEEVKNADMKAQRLFENCFQLIDGPTAPDMSIIEMDNKFIVHLSNAPGSNNYLEGYEELDPFIVCPEDDKTCDNKYRFQGYIVYQLKDATVTLGELTDVTKAKQIFQCDLNDDVSQIVNFIWQPDLNASVPVEYVNGANTGVQHSFEITEDLFSDGASRDLVNYKDYYYLAVAYAYNNYAPYEPVNTGSLGYQTTPYLAGRKNISVQKVLPHPSEIKDGGTVVNSEYGDTPEITVVEGRGNGNNALVLTEETYRDILSKTEMPFKADKLTYAANNGPIQVKVIDPLNVLDADYSLKFSPDSVNFEGLNYFNKGDSSNVYPTTGLIYDTKWILTYSNDGTTDTVISDSWIRYEDEKIIPELGISITVEQINFPGQGVMKVWNEKENVNNGFIGATSTYNDITPQWMKFVADVDGQTAYNWIRTGKQAGEGTGIDWSDWQGVDDDQVYEKILGGTWAPYAFCSDALYGPTNNNAKKKGIRFSKYRLSNVDIVITKDSDLWTRSPVIEMAENDNKKENSLSENGALRFQLRNSPSLDKQGNPANATDDHDTVNVDAPNYIGKVGMSWFPGYAVDVETGERLNIAFGEDSWLVGENGNDMLFNPTSSVGDDIFQGTEGALGNPFFGGKHYIYIFGHNEASTSDMLRMPGYDAGKTIHDNLSYDVDLETRLLNEYLIWQHPSWCAIPMVEPGYEFLDYASMPDNPLAISLRVANPYFATLTDTLEVNENSTYPMYTFSTSAYSTQTGQDSVGKSQLDNVNIVPNPYYGYSEYEGNQIENITKIINLPERCTISIYNASGGLVRRFDKDNSSSYVMWDLKNQYNVPIASGMYIIHISSPELGEKVIKWLGSLRPIDLNSF